MILSYYNEELHSKTLREEGREDGIKEGIKEGTDKATFDNLKSIMTKLHKSPEEAMDILDISQEKRPFYRERLSK